MRGRESNIFLYSALFPVVWGAAQLLYKTFLPPNLKYAAIVTVAIALIAAMLISILFVWLHGRDFTIHERRRLMAYCVVWAVSFEIIMLFRYVHQREETSSSDVLGLFAFAISFAVIVNGLLLWYAFTKSTKRLIQWQLNKNKHMLTR